jgi:hypothetical protein
LFPDEENDGEDAGQGEEEDAQDDTDGFASLAYGKELEAAIIKREEEETPAATRANRGGGPQVPP